MPSRAENSLRNFPEFVLEASAVPTGAAQLPAVDALRRMWTLEYIRENGRTRWREGNEVGAARERFNSPYDVEAHHGMKGARGWDGYKVHFTQDLRFDKHRISSRTC